MNVKEIVNQYLKDHDYDGLFDDGSGECACGVDDLMPCGEIEISCEAGWQMKCDCGDHDFHIGENKRKRLRKRN